MQGFLIGAYKDEERLIRLVKSLAVKGKVYVHINLFSNIDASKLNSLNIHNAVFIKKVKVTWGGYSHLRAILYTLKLMCDDPQIDYIHIISGQDLLVKNWDYLEELFDNSDKIYMSCTEIEETPKSVQNKYLYWHFNTHIDSRKIWYRILDYLLCFFQKKRKMFGTYEKLYKGMVWVSAPKNAFAFSIRSYENNKKFDIFLKHVIIPEEVFFQTIFMNSEFRDKIVFNNLRYTIWKERYGSVPAYLDESDIRNIEKSDCIFARKVDSDLSVNLIKYFDE